MAKQALNHTNLSAKELELLKDTYINLKVQSMSHDDLKDFATEHISLQIKSTIGNDEEKEAWQEMEDFFKDQFEIIISDIKAKFTLKNRENIHQAPTTKELKQSKSTNETNEEKKCDMWEE